MAQSGQTSHSAASQRRRGQHDTATAPLVSDCRLYIPGHTVHFIQARLSWEDPSPRPAEVVSIRGGVITLRIDAEVSRFRNHEPTRLRRLIERHGNRVLLRSSSVLALPHRDGSMYLFSVAAAQEPWRPCRFDEPTGADATSLLERARTHGGFVVSGREVLEALGP